VKRAFVAALLLGALFGALIPIAAGEPRLMFVLVPAMAVGSVVGLPFLVLAIVLSLLGALLPLAIVAAIFGGPFYLLHRLTRRADGAVHADDDDVELGPEALLRRRYVAGELAYDQFRDGMMDALKRRYAAGQISLGEYEREVDRLLAPARLLDVKGDPSVASAHPRG
jgi:uncharacterized membrane protein